MGVAQRYNKVLVHHTLGVPSLAKYEMQFPPGRSVPIRRRRCPPRCSTPSPPPKPPKTVAVVTSKFPSIQFMSAGAREVIKKRGLNEVLFSNGTSATATSARSPTASRTPSPTSSGLARSASTATCCSTP